MGKILVIGGGKHETGCTAYNVETKSHQDLPVNEFSGTCGTMVVFKCA